MARQIIFILILCLVWFPARAGGSLSIVASDSNPLYANARHDGLVDRIAREAFARAGIPVILGLLPSERAIRNVEEGLDDGDLMRIEGLEQHYPHLVRLSEPWIEMDFVAFTREGAATIGGWEDLKERDVAFIKGWQIFENRHFAAARVDRVVDADHLFRLLQLGRTDAALYDRLQGLYLARKMGFRARVQEPPLATRAIYLYLNRKHEVLISRLNGALRAMKEDGVHRRLLEEGFFLQGVDP